MALSTGTRLGPYEIVAQLGAGGMGEVYRARDTRLERSVAIKVLGGDLAADPQFRLRFEREARAVSSLDHPNICALFDVGQQDDTAYLVMPLLDGETLADRLASRRPEARALPVPEALKIAIEVAGALEAAHERGIVHRDLKPANIFVMRDGSAKILDFGLAKDLAPGAGGGKTTLAGATEAGVILGTAAYMSPEQVRGLAVDKRTDIWAFGCVLYEMLTGRRPFAGDTRSDLMVAVLEREPDWHPLPELLPAGVKRLLHRSLQKDPRQRLHDIADARIELQESRVEPSTQGAASPVRPRRPFRRERLLWMAATAALAVALAWGAAQRFSNHTIDAPETRLDLSTPRSADPISFAVSPDGRSVAFVASTDGPARLWVRELDGSSARELPGTEGAALPFWSPDGRSLGYFTTQKLKRIDLSGGAAQTLADVSPGVGGSWGDREIVFARTLAGGLAKVSDRGGDVTDATTLAPRQAGHTFPHFLPGGRRFLYYAAGAGDTQGVYVGSLDGEPPTMLTRADTAGVFAAGWMLFVRETTLLARRFDPSSRTLTGDPVTVASPVMVTPALRLSAAFSASASGIIAYRLEGSSQRQLTWFDRAGKPVGTFSEPDDHNLADPELSPDGLRAAVSRTIDGNTDIWIVDADRSTRLTSNPLDDQFPVWSPSGDRVAFSSSRGGSLDIYEMPASSAGTEKLLLASPTRKVPTDWSPDGRFLLYHSASPSRGPDIVALAMAPPDKSFPVADSIAPEVWGQLSPDGRLVAFQSFATGRSEISIQQFPKPSGQWTVSTNGGLYPRWARDGRELYYIQPDGKLMAAALTQRGDKPATSPPVPLFQPPIVGGGTNVIGRRQQYDVAPDGRFLINVSLREVLPSPITVVVNWKPK